MKQIKTFLTVCLLTVFSWRMVSAADLPIISPADGSADVCIISGWNNGFGESAALPVQPMAAPSKVITLMKELEK